MTALARALRDVIEGLGADARFALVGGLAVSARTEPRFTRDIDLAMVVEGDAEAEEIVNRLVRAGYATRSVLENTRLGRLATVRMRRTPRSPIVDLLFSACGIETEVADAATPLTVLGQSIRVARIGHLIVMKLVARDDHHRPQDAIDLRALTLAADEAEWTLAAAAVELAIERGFATDRDLRSSLATWRDRPE